MGHSQSDKAQSRERILDVAARKIREQGIDSLSIGDLMKAANLTHGGFYRHFASRDALIVEALQRAIDQADDAFGALPSGAGAAKAITQRYLSAPHRDNPGGGCAVSALAGDVGRMSDRSARSVLAAKIERNFEEFADLLGDAPEAESAAIHAWSTMVGAMVLSRVFRGTRRSDEVLKVARQAVIDIAEAASKGGIEKSPAAGRSRHMREGQA